MPEIWKMIVEDRIAAYNVPSGIMFDMHREAAARRPGVLTTVGLDTFVDPIREGCAMHALTFLDQEIFAPGTALPHKGAGRSVA
jgi:acyl CoA:acetate/3-ketoacid CoA transferase